MNTKYFVAGRRSGKQEFTRTKMEEMVNTMSEDGHKYFFGQMPEMPWKKEKTMDDKFKSLLLQCLVTIILVLLYRDRDDFSTNSIHKLSEDIDEYIRKLG